MANRSKILPDNVPGEFYVDDTCIDCGACRNYAPAVFAAGAGASHVGTQPANDAARFHAFQAMLACPTNSIGASTQNPGAAHVSTKLPKAVHASFPMIMEGDSGAAGTDVNAPLPDGVYLNGFNHRDSFGADSYFIRDPRGNWLIDSPRFHPHLIPRYRQAGGISHIFLTHRDDVADANKYAKEFDAKRVIHEQDARACPDAEIIMKGDQDLVIGNARIIFTPGHTRGHGVLLWKNRFLFTGDHLPWESAAQALRPFSDACWYSWGEQIRSVEKLAGLTDVAHVLTGHGERWHRTTEKFPALIAEAVTWMKDPNRRPARP